jgi:hypothetical protein
MKPTIVSSYGIHNGRKSATDVFLAEMRALGYRTEDPELAYRWALTAWWSLRKDAREVRDVLRHGDALVCHSYGCLRGTRGAEMALEENGEIVSVLFLIAPAMSKDYKFERLHPKTKVVCLHSTADKAVKWGARWPFHPFGSAGNVGFNDDHVINVEMPGTDHGGYFQQPKLNQCVELLVSALPV